MPSINLAFFNYNFTKYSANLIIFALFNNTESLHALNVGLMRTHTNGCIQDFNLGGRISRPEEPSYEARRAESGSGILG